MIIEKLVVGPLATNCYIVTLGEEAVVIDPGAGAKEIVDFATKHSAKITKIICTHAHTDHIGAAAELARITGAKVYMHTEDKELLDKGDESILLFFGAEPEKVKDFVPISDGDVMKMNQLEFKIIHTPGHTPGSVSVLVKDKLFTGDFIFAGSVGRTDLHGGSYDMLMKSIKSKITGLPELIKIYPGHGPETTLREEKKSNPYLQGI